MLKFIKSFRIKDRNIQPRLPNDEEIIKYCRPKISAEYKIYKNGNYNNAHSKKRSKDNLIKNLENRNGEFNFVIKEKGIVIKNKLDKLDKEIV